MLLVILLAVLIWYLIKSKRRDSYLPVKTISTDLKNSPPPHEPTVIKKSVRRTRVFSGSKSKSRSRSNNKKEENDFLYTCVNNESDKGHANLNSCNPNICSSTGGVDNLVHDGVVLDLEDCCQMTICDTVRK